ncbi:superoxide dismutase [Deinococcus sp.]|uniref:superoxide dismutase n=1 Tax=Deinococcus sp. TaxID=47478 RepID=UPI0025F0BBED|nr:superoxide dismutase [Deinococcus sp.]
MSAVLLSACNMMGTGAPASYSLSKQTSAPSTLANPVGNVAVKDSGNMRMTTAKLMGLAPNTYYVAHYHVQGTESTEPCKSNGAPLMSSKIVALSDATGMVTLSGSVNKSEVLQATYFNVHTAKNADGTPNDAGVLCSAVKMM